MTETVVDSGAHRKRVGLKIIGRESCWAVGSHWNGGEKKVEGGRAVKVLYLNPNGCLAQY